MVGWTNSGQQGKPQMLAKSKSMARKIEKGNVRLNPIKNIQLGGGFKDFLFSPLPGEMIQFD